jgi:hypothetical protein
MFPALFSHAVDVQAFVATVLGRGLDSALVTRFTATAARQCSLLLVAIAGVAISPGCDTRMLTRCAMGGCAPPKIVCFGGVRAKVASFVWGAGRPRV